MLMAMPVAVEVMLVVAVEKVKALRDEHWRKYRQDYVLSIFRMTTIIKGRA